MRAREEEATVAVDRVGAATAEAMAAAETVAERVEVAREEATVAERVAMAERVEATAAAMAAAEKVDWAAARVEAERVEAVTVRGTVKRCAPLPG